MTSMLDSGTATTRPGISVEI